MLYYYSFTCGFSANSSLDVVSAKDRLLKLKSVHCKERHAERLERVLHVLAVEDHLRQHCTQRVINKSSY